MAMSTERQLARLSWTQVRELAAREGSTVVWPWGAVEQHGPHLPLGTDALFAERVLEAVLQALPPEWPICRLPPQMLGFSPEHLSFPGTLSLSAPLVLELVSTVGQQLARAGFQRLVLFNAHGGQIALLQAAARQLHEQAPSLGVLPCFLWSGPEGVAQLIPEPERHQGLHAGLAETSLMLHLAPEQVGPLRPRDGCLPSAPPQGWDLEGAVPVAWLTAELSASGVIGSAAGADAALGGALFERLVAGWIARFESLLPSDWPPRAYQLSAGAGSS
ncbi:MAG: creatininase family protein [Cyanobium sp.]